MNLLREWTKRWTGSMEYYVRVKVIATHVNADFDGFAAMIDPE